MDIVDQLPISVMGDLVKSSMEKVLNYSSKILTVASLNAIMMNWITFLPRNMSFKYNEDKLLQELRDYVASTYNQHYSAGNDKIQTLDLIESVGDAEAFCRSNILKYASRYDKKGTARRDIIKILHYALLLLHFSDKTNVTEEYPNR